MTKSRHYTLTCLSSSCSKAPRLSLRSLTRHFLARSTTSCQLSLITNHHRQTDTQTERQTQTPYLDFFVQLLFKGFSSLLEEPDSTARSMTSCHMSLINNQHKQTDTHTYIHTNRKTTQTEWQTQTPYLDLFVQFLLEGSTSLLEEPDSTLLRQVNDLLPVVSQLLHLLNLRAGQAELVASEEKRKIKNNQWMKFKVNRIDRPCSHSLYLKGDRAG